MSNETDDFTRGEQYFTDHDIIDRSTYESETDEFCKGYKNAFLGHMRDEFGPSVYEGNNSDTYWDDHVAQMPEPNKTDGAEAPVTSMMVSDLALELRELDMDGPVTMFGVPVTGVSYGDSSGPLELDFSRGDRKSYAVDWLTPKANGTAVLNVHHIGEIPASLFKLYGPSRGDFGCPFIIVRVELINAESYLK